MGVVFLKEHAIKLVLYSLPNLYLQFIMNFHRRNLDVTLMELSDILEVVEVDMITSSTYTRSLAIGYGNNGD